MVFLSSEDNLVSNKDYLSCLSQAIETTGNWWPVSGTGYEVAWKPGPGPRKGFLSQERGRTGLRESKHSPGHYPEPTGFRSGKLAWRNTPGPSLHRGGELWGVASGSPFTFSSGESLGVPREMADSLLQTEGNKRQAD